MTQQFIVYLPSAVQVLSNVASDLAPSYEKRRRYFRICFERPAKTSVRLGCFERPKSSVQLSCVKKHQLY